MCSAVFYSLFGKRLAYETSQVVYRLQIILCERVGERIALCLMVHSYPDIVCSPTYLSNRKRNRFAYLPFGHKCISGTGQNSIASIGPIIGIAGISVVSRKSCLSAQLPVELRTSQDCYI